MCVIFVVKVITRERAVKGVTGTVLLPVSDEDLWSILPLFLRALFSLWHHEIRL